MNKKKDHLEVELKKNESRSWNQATEIMNSKKNINENEGLIEDTKKSVEIIKINIIKLEKEKEKCGK